ncbi:MAG: helix-turn-helix domain-containing protein [Planctomycetota bacterium]
MHYQEYTPPNSLRHLVRCVWVFENSTHATMEDTIVADGFPELILHCGVPSYEESLTGIRVRQTSVIAAGQLTRPLRLGSPSGSSVLAIRFQPWGLSRFLPGSMHELTDCRQDVRGHHRGGLEGLQAALTQAPGSARVPLVFAYLIQQRLEAPDPMVMAAIQTMESTCGKLRIAPLADRLGVSRRKLELAFRQDVGVTPKQFARIVRFRRVHQEMLENPDRRWVEAALDAGFFDQPHLVRDFQQFAGRSPSQTLQDACDAPPHFCH